VQPGGVIVGPKLLINGQPAPTKPGLLRGQFVLRRNDGREVMASWKPQMLGLDTPQIVVDGKTHTLVEPLKWYQWLWSILPMGLVFVGGALGALIGLITMSLNLRFQRSSLNGPLKFLLTGALTIVGVVGYFILAILLYNLING
jgi:hypothetical protein